ncbi:MAG: DnaB-like helicase C-terminal domain-containing protein [Anaerolineae bacterium]
MQADLDTGFRDLDRILGGLRPGTLTLVSALPGYGAQTFLLGIAAHVAAQRHRPVTILTVVAPREEVAGCFDALVSSSGGYLNMPSMPDRQRLLLANRAEVTLRLLPVTIVELGGSLPHLRDMALKLHADRPSDLLVVLGPLEALSTGSRGPLSRWSRTVGEPVAVTAGLRQLACELQVPLLLQSGVSAAARERVDRRPRLSDLPAEGRIARHCDTILFLSSLDEPPAHATGGSPAQVIIAHSRHGPLDAIVLRFCTIHHRFENP